MQVRKLKIKVPITYKRIQPITQALRDVQETLVKYPSTITDDSDFEEDDVVLEKYHD
jgi:hypothetical protein